MNEDKKDGNEETAKGLVIPDTTPIPTANPATQAPGDAPAAIPSMMGKLLGGGPTGTEVSTPLTLETVSQYIQIVFCAFAFQDGEPKSAIKNLFSGTGMQK